MELERGILLLQNILLSVSLNSDKVLANVILNKKLIRPTQCGYKYRFRSSRRFYLVS